MDINTYRKYIRDMEISDEDLNDLLKIVISDIARDTKIFNYQFSFNLTDCIDYYNIKDLCNLSTSMQSIVTDVNYTEDTIDNEDTVNLINLITSTEIQQSCDINSKNIKEEKTLIAPKYEYLSTKDIILIDESHVLYNPRSVIDEFFFPVDNVSYLAKHDYINNNIAHNNKYNILLLADVIIIPNVEDIAKDQEDIIRSAIIAGIKYFISDMYVNTQNEQVSNILYQRYYSTKKQLVYNYPQYISNYLNFTGSNNWNNK